LTRYTAEANSIGKGEHAAKILGICVHEIHKLDLNGTLASQDEVHSNAYSLSRGDHAVLCLVLGGHLLGNAHTKLNTVLIGEEI